MELWLDPPTHRLVGRTTLEVTAEGESAKDHGPALVEFTLHPGLAATQVRTSIPGRYFGVIAPGNASDGEFAPATHAIVLDRVEASFGLDVVYEGALLQDVARGEKPGEIHNFAMRAHVDVEGVYLADGNWYPQPTVGPGSVPALADFELVVEPVPGMELIAGAEPDPVLGERIGRLAWRSSSPVKSMVLVGGPWQTHVTRHRGIRIVQYIKSGQVVFAGPWFAAARRTLDRYEPLLGPYPVTQYAMVSNFFSSGFAFPGFTLLSPAVIEMGERAANTHGYLDHEMLHSWWGNGVFVDPRDGNWCESLASYAANYYGHVLDGNDAEARRIRRNYCHFLSRIKPEEDRPLGTYDRPDGCGRGVAYQKGAMVFHMLARKIGQEKFWEAMRDFNGRYQGRYASWEEIRTVCERASGEPLASFFGQWVRRGGAPQLRIEDASYDESNEELTIRVVQSEPPFELEVPIRVLHDDGVVDLSVPLRQVREEITVPLEVEPIEIELDPDYHLFHRVLPEDIVPTTALTRGGSAFACVLPAGEVGETHANLQSIFESSFPEEQRIVRTAKELEAGALAERSVLILGDAVRCPYVSGFLSAIEFPVRFDARGFEFDGVLYPESRQAVLCTVAHPGVKGGGVTVVFANSEAAYPSAANIPMYDASLVIFQDRKAILKRDFERRRIVVVDE